MSDPRGTVDRLRAHLWSGCRVALGDGAGAPVGLRDALTTAARDVGGVRALLGWSFALPVDLDDAIAFPDVASHMSGYALRAPIRSGRVRYVPVRLGTLGKHLAGSLRPDVLVASVRPGERGLIFGTEVAWMRAAVGLGIPVLAEVNHGLPDASDGVPIPTDQVVVVAETDRPPLELARPEPDPVADAIGRNVARLVPEHATIQFGPGAVTDAVVRHLDVPVTVDSGLVTDAVLDLEARGLLVGVPRGAYVAGTTPLFAWTHGKPVAGPIEVTHDIGRLGALDCFVAINTALEIDCVGQVNVERVGGQPIGGIGGHPDFCVAASRSPRGMSVIALPSEFRGTPTLVELLSCPTTTIRSDVDIIVTDRGIADLRGLDDREREHALRDLWA